MSARMARMALALYPLAFRHRYDQEMLALLQQTPARPRTVLDLLRGAFAAHLRPQARLGDLLNSGTRVRLGLSGVLVCWLAFAAAGFGFYKTTEDRPFSNVGDAHRLLGDAHLTVQVLAVLASGAVILGALPLIFLALRQARRERGRLRVLVSLPLAAVLVFTATTALLVLLVHSKADDHRTTADGIAFIAWTLSGLACGALCVVTARKALFAIPVAKAWLASALAFATLVTVAMLVISLATALYTLALPMDAPHLAGEPNGPLQTMSVSASLVMQLIVMSVCAVAAMTSTRRAWAALEHVRPAI